jgi:hypothetical protein
MGKWLAKAILCLSIVVWVTTAMSQVDPDPNGIGIYFDEGANVYCMQTEVGNQTSAYLCLTRITSESGISKWEAKVEVSRPSDVLAWNLMGQGTNTSETPEFNVDLTEPLPWQSSLVVLEMTISIQAVHPLVFRVHPVENPSVPGAPFPLPAYALGDDPSEFRTLGYSWGWDPATGEPNWCAVINPAGDCSDPPTANSSSSWGGIKALYTH